jgi:hypothetical protein
LRVADRTYILIHAGADAAEFLEMLFYFFPIIRRRRVTEVVLKVAGCAWELA